MDRQKSTDAPPRAIVVGASSGIGHEVAKLLLAEDYMVGVAARREQPLLMLRSLAPRMVKTAVIDVTSDDAAACLQQLVDALGGIDLFFYASGIGKQNMTLEAETELATVRTNALGFCRMVGEAYRIMAHTGHGHIAVISSIAGTKGLGVAPAYSATKAMQNVYMQALAQQSRMRGFDISFTDIRPGFVDTPLLASGSQSYPMLLDSKRVAWAIVRAIRKRRRVAVIDWRWHVLTFFWRALPSWLWERLKIQTSSKSSSTR